MNREGRNIALDIHYSEGRSGCAGEIAAEFVRLGVDVIVAHFTPAVRAAPGALLRRHQASVVSEHLQLAAEMMGPDASLHAD
jgi:hypothetical protein